MRFKHKRKTYPAIKIRDVYYVRDEEFLKSECYKEYKKLKEELKHKNQLWKTAFKAYKNLKNKVETTLFPVEYIDFICATGIQSHPDEDRVVYDFSMPWHKVKKYLDKKYKRVKKIK